MKKVSAITATWNSDRKELLTLIESVQNQTMNSNEYELILVDDGSPDNLYFELLELQKKYSFLRVFRLKNSGYNTIARNYGLLQAEGDYVFWIDHDDFFYPQAFQRAIDFAEKNNLDVVNAKEHRTKGWTWGFHEFRENVVGEHHIKTLLPMTPHKFYRREFLLDNEIFFPEGSRVLWEDVSYNTAIYNANANVGVLADYSVYQWVNKPGSLSSGFGNDIDEKWAALHRLFDTFINDISDVESQRYMINHWYKSRVLTISGAWLNGKNEDNRSKQFSYAVAAREKLIDYLDFDKFTVEELISDLWLQNNDLESAIEYASESKSVEARALVNEVHFEANQIVVSASAVLKNEDGPIKLRSGLFSGAHSKDISKKMKRIIPQDILTYRASDEMEGLFVPLIKGRNTRIPWEVKDIQKSNIKIRKSGEITAELVFKIDLKKFMNDEADENQPWDLATRFEFLDYASQVAISFEGDFKPVYAIIDGMFVVVYKNKSNFLSVAVNNSIDNLISKVGFDQANMEFDGEEIKIPLNNVYVSGNFDQNVPVIFENEKMQPKQSTGYTGNLILENGKVWLSASLPIYTGQNRIIIRVFGKDTVIDYEK